MDSIRLTLIVLPLAFIINRKPKAVIIASLVLAGIAFVHMVVTDFVKTLKEKENPETAEEDTEGYGKSA